MRKVSAASGTALFFAAAPGVVAGAVPWALADWRMAGNLPPWVRAVGGAVTFAAAVLLIHSFARFVIEGSGTPAPPAPTERLVVGGLYRYVRNPMYLAVLGAILGQGTAPRAGGPRAVRRRRPGRRRVLRPLVRGTDAG